MPTGKNSWPTASMMSPWLVTCCCYRSHALLNDWPRWANRKEKRTLEVLYLQGAVIGTGQNTYDMIFHLLWPPIKNHHLPADHQPPHTTNNMHETRRSNAAFTWAKVRELLRRAAQVHRSVSSDTQSYGGESIANNNTDCVRIRPWLCWSGAYPPPMRLMEGMERLGR